MTEDIRAHISQLAHNAAARRDDVCAGYAYAVGVIQAIAEDTFLEPEDKVEQITFLLTRFDAEREEGQKCTRTTTATSSASAPGS